MMNLPPESFFLQCQILNVRHFLPAFSINKMIFIELETHCSEHLLELKITNLKTPVKCHLFKMFYIFLVEEVHWPKE